MAVAEQLGDTPEDPEVGVLVTVGGSFPSQLLLLLRPPDARRLGHLLGEGDATTERLLDVCRELGMIVAGRYLETVERVAERSGKPMPPISAVDMFAAIVQTAVATAGDTAIASVFEVLVSVPDDPVRMRLVVLT